jgi:diacylglycerol O-acyltransferase/trehalose O-mycolyltransferase
MRRLWAAGAVVTMCLVSGGAPVMAQGPSAIPPPSLWTIGQAADDGARIVKVEALDARTRDLTIESPAVGTVQVRLLLPSSFGAAPTARFPVLLLLHGAGGEYVDWTEETDVEGATAATNLLVAMPAAAASNMDTWEPKGGALGTGGRPNWETFHLTELRELLERNWQAGDDRAVAGLSLGGYSAMMYAARHPDLFKAVASYSGVLDLTVAPGISAKAQALAGLATQVAQAAGWDEANPINLVPSLGGESTYVSFGNGEPGPLDPAGTERDELEAWVGHGDEHFVAALDEAGIPASVNAYGPGTHSWSYWDRELHDSMAMLLEALGEVPPSPSAPSAF